MLSSVEWENVKRPATTSFLQGWAPNWFTFLLASLGVLLWLSLTLFPQVIVVVGREKQGETGLYQVAWAKSPIITNQLL